MKKNQQSQKKYIIKENNGQMNIIKMIKKNHNFKDEQGNKLIFRIL